MSNTSETTGKPRGLISADGSCLDREDGMKSSCCWTLSLLSLLWAAPCFGTSVRMSDPFEGIHHISVHILIGSHLRIEGGQWLFEGQRDRASRFEEDLRHAIAAKLGECAIEATPQSDAELHLRLFGGPVGGEHCPALSMFLVELEIFKDEGEPGSDGGRLSRGLLGAAEDDRLEAEILTVVLSALDEAMYDCSKRELGGQS